MAATIVQSKATTSTTSITLDSATTTGNKIIVVAWAYGNNITAVTDSKSNTYTARAVANLNATKVSIYEGPDSPTMGASHSFTVSASGALDTGICAIEVSGLLTTPFDKNANNHVTATPLAVGPTATLSQADEFVVAGTCIDSGDTTVTPSAGEGWTQIGEAENGSAVLVFNVVAKVVSATTALSATWAIGSFSGADGVIATFKATSGAGGNTGTLASTLDPITSNSSGTSAGPPGPPIVSTRRLIPPVQAVQRAAFW